MPASRACVSCLQLQASPACAGLSHQASSGFVQLLAYRSSRALAPPPQHGCTRMLSLTTGRPCQRPHTPRPPAQVGISIWTYLTSVFVTLLIHLNAASSEYVVKSAALDSFMAYRRLPKVGTPPRTALWLVSASFPGPPRSQPRCQARFRGSKPDHLGAATGNSTRAFQCQHLVCLPASACDSLSGCAFMLASCRQSRSCQAQSSQVG